MGGGSPTLQHSPWVPSTLSVFQAASLSTGEGSPHFELQTQWSNSQEVGAPQHQALCADNRVGRPASLSLPLPTVLLRAHPEGRHEAAPLAHPLGFQGILVAQPFLDKLQN